MTGGTLYLKCKDFRILQIDIIGTDQFFKVLESLNNLTNIGKVNHNTKLS